MKFRVQIKSNKKVKYLFKEITKYRAINESEKLDHRPFDENSN